MTGGTSSQTPTRSLQLKNRSALLPEFITRNASYTAQAQDISILQQPPVGSSTTPLTPAGSFSLTTNPTGAADPVTFSAGPPIVDMTVVSSPSELGLKLPDESAAQWVLSATGLPATQQVGARTWLLIRYTLVKQGG